MAGTICALLDATVLYPASLRDLLMRLTTSNLFQARWSNDIHEEWIRSVLCDRPDLTAAQLHSVRDAMDLHAEDCLVTGSEHLIASLSLPDQDDRHVLAAAIPVRTLSLPTTSRIFHPKPLPRITLRHGTPMCSCAILLIGR